MRLFMWVQHWFIFQIDHIGFNLRTETYTNNWKESELQLLMSDTKLYFVSMRAMCNLQYVMQFSYMFQVHGIISVFKL